MEILSLNLLDVGPIYSNESGWHRILWIEFKSWIDVTGTVLTPWESQSIMVSSEFYASAVNQYFEKTVNAPFDRILTDEEQKIESDRANAAVEAQIDKAWMDSDNG